MHIEYFKVRAAEIRWRSMVAPSFQG